MTRVLLFAALILVPALAAAQSGTMQYISDDIAVTLRDAPRNDAQLLGVLHSGERLSVLQSLGEDSFARVRTTGGQEGWITARYLSPTPAAKDRLAQMKAALDDTKAQLASVQDELKSAKGRLDAARPAFELSQENARLKSELAARQQALDAAMQRFDEERARRMTLITGAALLAGGVIVGLFLPSLLQSRRRRRYGDF